ncbi:MAG: threonine--tRNA ligase [Planctomycetota bacterium]|jgi:threonyl-tRNA synthetase
MPVITLPDNSTLEFDAPVSVRDVAERIHKKLAKRALAGEVDGTVVDLNRVIDADAAVRILTAEDAEGVTVMRHSASHVLAEAIEQLFPGTKLVYGPAIDDGFYYDVDSPEAISAEDLPKLEKAMQKIVKKNAPFERIEVSHDEAVSRSDDNEYKLENIKNAKGDTLSFYKQNEFEDLCMGPHVPSTGKIGKFKLTAVSGAYLHGDATKQQLTRVYGTCFPTQEELDEHLRRIEEAKKRDHRKLGKELGLFEFHAEAPGMAFWRNNGTILYQQVEGFLRALCQEHRYDELRTPQILNKELWLKSGHWANYADKMYISEKDGREFGVKPMNCPGGVILYNANLYSHNDLPLRWAEFGHVHRYEGSGEIHGLVRVRGFTQDDAHIFCTPTQLKDEIKHCIELMFTVYKTFGMDFDHIELSTRPEKRIGTDTMWDTAEEALKVALEELEIAYVLNPGDGAFYGPKIDFHLADAIGRTWQMGTIQVDFAMPENFDMTYVDADSSRQRPVMIHRAISGSLERFIGILVEHFAGDFPLWMAPEQVRILTITDGQLAYADEIAASLKAAGIRVTVNRGTDKVGAKIRHCELAKIPYTLVLGDREVEERTVSCRRRLKGDLGSVGADELVKRLTDEVAEKTLPEDVKWETD